MPRSFARSSSRSVSGVAARSAAQSSRPIVRNRLPASITPGTLRSPRVRRCNPLARARKQRGDYPTPPLARRRASSPTPCRTASPAAAVHGARPGVRRRPLPRRRRPPAARRPAPCPTSSAWTSTPASVTAARRALAGARRRRRVARRARRRPRHDWGGAPLRRRRRQPAVPLAAGRGDDARRRQPPRRRPVRRRRGRVPRPRRAARPPGGGRIGLVLPQSILASRDAARRARRARPAGDDRRGRGGRRGRVFDAQVLVCALAFERRARRRPTAAAATLVERRRHRRARRAAAARRWRRPATLGERARLTANFRDQYYGLVPAVVEDGDGPPLVTSGLVDPGRCAWGRRDVTFAAGGSAARPSTSTA